MSNNNDNDDNKGGGRKHWEVLALAMILTVSMASQVYVCILSFFSPVWPFATLWTIACQAPLSTEFSRQAYWSGLPRPPPGDLPDPGNQPTSLLSPALAGWLVTTSSTWEALTGICAVLRLVAQSCPTLCDPMDCSPPGSSVLRDSPGKNTGVGCHALLQRIFPIQGSYPGLLHCRQILYCLSHHGRPRILEWVIYPLSRGTSWPRNQTGVSCIAGGFFTNWATREAQKYWSRMPIPSAGDLLGPGIQPGSPALQDHQRHISSNQFSRSVVSDSLWPYGLQHARHPCPSLTPGVYSNSCPLSRWCHPIISSSVLPISSYPQSFPASGSFPVSQFFTSGGQSIGVSASTSVLPMNIQDWFPLGWTGWISLQSKGLSRVFSNTTVQKHQFFGTQLSLYYNSHIHTWLLEKPQSWLDGPLLAK